jgi:hypothetical protein
MIRLERACENEVHKGCMFIKEVYHRCPDGCSACPDCNGTGTITRDPSHEELQEIAGRMHRIVSAVHEHGNCLMDEHNACWDVAEEIANNALTYIKDGITWNVKEGE